jgi:alpha-amylase
MPAQRSLVALFIVTVTALAAAPAWAHDGVKAHHSLRNAVTDQNFYFVMADRFENGTTENDHGELPPGKEEGQSGFDPTGRGWYHGGDLQGLRDQLSYIKRLGTTAIWLTPSFKNKAVQPQDNSAGYHGYWITDFKQIDPHLGSNDDLKALVRDAHRLGIKVYFDIITNHTADVVGYAEGRRRPYVSKDAEPYRTAAGTVFDDRDFAGTGSFPPLDVATSFPYTPTVEADEPTKNPAWLNDLTLYHNRGDTTFVGENSQYGDFFGLDDLFTENPKVVNGMIDIYKFWIKEFRVDGFRMDTMKHVDDAFWQKFSPEIERYARSQGIRDFYMFGEVAEDFDVGITSHYPIHDDVQGVLDFLFQMSAVDFAGKSLPTNSLRDFFLKDDWYTDGDSNAYNMPTFLGNHDRGRIGMFVRTNNPGATDDEVLRRDRLAHALMYLSRGNPVVYYGDEQGFVGDGGDQLARQDMFPSQVPEYNDDDLIGTDATTAESNFDTTHPLYRRIRRLARVTERYPALRDGQQQHRYSSGAAGIYAFSRTDGREFVVALNNAESSASAAIPTYMRSTRWEKVFGRGPDRLWSGSDRRLDVTLPGLSTVVYRAQDKLPRSHSAPSIALDVPRTGRDRLAVGADLGSSAFAEVTFLAKTGHGSWRDIGTDDNAPYRVFHDVSDVKPGTKVEYRAIVLDNAGHTRSSGVRSSTISQPAITWVKPNEGSNVRGGVDLELSVVPEHATDVVKFERRIGSGAWTVIGTDSSSPVYSMRDTFSLDLPTGTQISYRATLNGKVVSAVRSVRVQKEQITAAVVHYNRPPSDWGLHLWGDAIVTPTAWEAPFMPTGTDSFGSVFTIPLKNDTLPVNFIVHRTPPNSDEREPGGDRSFIPLDHPHIYLRQGDPTIYFNP